MRKGPTMPLDLRTTIFSEEELATALTEYAARNKVALPPTRVERVTIAWRPALSVKLTFAKDELDRVEELDFERNEVAAAVILYCHRFKEPVPHHAEKSIEPFEGGLQLLIRFPWGDQWSERHPARAVTFPSMRDVNVHVK